MQRIFRDQLLERCVLYSYRERIEGLRRGKGHAERPAAVLREFIADSIANLAHLEEHVEAALLEKAVRLLGERRAHPRAGAAPCLSSSLLLLRMRCRNSSGPATLMDGVGGMLHEQARGIGPRDVLVAVSFRNYSPEVIALAADCHHHRVPVVVVRGRPQIESAARCCAAFAFDLGDHSDRPVPLTGGADVPRTSPGRESWLPDGGGHGARAPAGRRRPGAQPEDGRRPPTPRFRPRP